MKAFDIVGFVLERQSLGVKGPFQVFIEDGFFGSRVLVDALKYLL